MFNTSFCKAFSPENSISDFYLVKYSNYFYGRLSEIKNKMSGPRGPLKVNRIVNKIECHVCGIVCDPRNFHRWHGEKCKQKIICFRLLIHQILYQTKLVLLFHY
jgi:hypothetical protein